MSGRSEHDATLTGLALRAMHVALLFFVVAGLMRWANPAHAQAPGAAAGSPSVPPAARTSTPPEPAAEARPADKEGPPGPQPHVALLLPLESTSLGSVAAVFRDGWQTAMDADGKRAPPLRVYATQDDQGALLMKAREAIAQGASLVVGGLTRDGARLLGEQGRWDIAILALNHPNEEAPLPDRFHFITLSIDNEARVAALAAFEDGWRSALIAGTATPLSRRVADAFEREWLRVGGTVVRRAVFNGSAQDAASLRPKTADVDADVVFYALDASEARTARPYLPMVRAAYGTSLLTDLRSDPVSNVDLAGTRFVEMPWFVQPDHPAVAIYARPNRPIGYEMEKLYALGIDAYRVATNLLKPVARRDPVIDGVTGRLEIPQKSVAIVRQPLNVEYADGRLVVR
jgi:uncharacterized protein